MDDGSVPRTASSAASLLSPLDAMPSIVSRSLSQSAAAAPADSSLESVSSWHGLSPSANVPEALQALDLARDCFHAGRFYKAERLCLRSLTLHRTLQAEQLLQQIYTRIPQQTRSQPHQPTAAPLSAAAASLPTASPAAAAPSLPSPSVPLSASWWSSALSAALAASRSPPAWLRIPRRHRRPLLFLWSLVAATAFLRCTGFFAAFDHSAYAHQQHRQQQQQQAVLGRAWGSRGGGGLVDPNWLLGLTNLFPLVLMLLFATGQWQRRQQQQQQQQH